MKKNGPNSGDCASPDRRRRLRADRFAVDEDEFRIRFSALFHDREELPFSVQPAILLKVDLMSIIAIRSELDTSLLMMG